MAIQSWSGPWFLVIAKALRARLCHEYDCLTVTTFTLDTVPWHRAAADTSVLWHEIKGLSLQHDGKVCYSTHAAYANNKMVAVNCAHVRKRAILCQTALENVNTTLDGAHLKHPFCKDRAYAVSKYIAVQSIAAERQLSNMALGLASLIRKPRWQYTKYSRPMRTCITSQLALHWITEENSQFIDYKLVLVYCILLPKRSCVDVNNQRLVVLRTNCQLSNSWEKNFHLRRLNAARCTKPYRLRRACTCESFAIFFYQQLEKENNSD